jgi:hypothetical protein
VSELFSSRARRAIVGSVIVGVSKGLVATPTLPKTHDDRRCG